jgi:hypothetical protein
MYDQRKGHQECNAQLERYKSLVAFLGVPISGSSFEASDEIRAIALDFGCLVISYIPGFFLGYWTASSMSCPSKQDRFWVA